MDPVAVAKLHVEKARFVREMYALINKFMSQGASNAEPEYALGLVMGGAAEALADYSASYRLVNQLPDTWSETCVAGLAKYFSDTHYAHLHLLAHRLRTDVGEPISLS
jgi:hypothetical protein